jgi:hypothetical protein
LLDERWFLLIQIDGEKARAHRWIEASSDGERPPRVGGRIVDSLVPALVSKLGCFWSRRRTSPPTAITVRREIVGSCPKPSRATSGREDHQGDNALCLPRDVSKLRIALGCFRKEAVALVAGGLLRDNVNRLATDLDLRDRVLL